MSKLLDLMKNLGSDAALAKEYAQDPEGVMQRAGLSDEERRAMAEKDYTAKQPNSPAVQRVRVVAGQCSGRYFPAPAPSTRR